MAEPAKWIKITTDTFEDEKIDLIEGMPSGEKMVITWFKILLLAGKCNADGYLLLQEDMPFTAEMLARRFKQDLGIIKLALGVFRRYKMIQINNIGIYVTNFNRYQDLDRMNQKRAQDRDRKQKQREKEKVLIEEPKSETVAAESEAAAQENVMSRVTSQNNGCDNHCDMTCDNDRDSSYSASTSSSISNSNIFLRSSSNLRDDINSGDNINLKSSSSFNSSINNKLYIEFFNNNFHQITDHEEKILTSYEKQGMDPQAITLALEEAVEENARHMRYVKIILDRWLDKKILTVESVKADKADFKNKRNAFKQSNESNKKFTTKPSNFNNFEQRDYDYDSLEKRLLGWVGSG